MTTVPCHGRAKLFEATTQAAHKRAAAICVDCPLLASGECEARFYAAVKEFGFGPHIGPRGTWAGRLIGSPKRTVVRPRGDAA